VNSSNFIKSSKSEDFTFFNKVLYSHQNPIARAQPWRGAKGAERKLSLARSKLRKKIKILADFVHTTLSKCYCNIIIFSQLSNFFAF